MDSAINDFGSRVFSDEVMKKELPPDTYESLKKSIDLYLPIEPEVASIVATSMKKWAIKNGATHYTHWFQPMTGITAGKHDSFIALKNEKIELEFSGRELIKGEPDASSFPNGGLRNTFEARGYTVWDCTSPAFIKEKTLYIPTAFCSYNGEALDTKTPLLKSIETISKQSVKILRAFKDNETLNVVPNVGAEQEYFLIDRRDYEKRLDLKICGRTLFGTKPPKAQEMDDHYCSRIRLKVSEYMQELDRELWSLGICSKTRHNEAAPAQHEMAPMFESCNVAADHNQLTMEVMRTVAKKKDLVCLLHEKPFKNVNGSGKHNNWSLAKNNGENLLKVGKTKEDNMQFLIFLCAIIRGVEKYSGLLQMSAASSGNDHRLGGNEAPPAIMSIFLGNHLLKILNDIADGKNVFSNKMEDVLITKTNTLPNLQKDENDRNRTSPFAFTGNKFEFRMLGASASVSLSTTVINLAVSESLEHFLKVIEENNFNLEKSTLAIVSSTIKNHGHIIFNGNSYSKSWEQESKKRGLKSVKDAVSAALEFVEEKNVELFEHFKVLSKFECRARCEIMLEKYSKTTTIEAATMLEMVNKEILPAVLEHTNNLSETFLNLKSCEVKCNFMLEEIEELTSAIENITYSKNVLKDLLVDIKKFDTNLEKAEFCRDKIVQAMNNLRAYVDNVEQKIPKKLWNMPYVSDLLYRI